MAIRTTLMGCAIAGLLFSVPAAAGTIALMPGHIENIANGDGGGGGVPVISPGRGFQISCDEIETAAQDVRVVMSFDDEPGQTATGYSAILATNQKVARHAVRIRVPDVPDLENHTVDVKVYVTDGRNTKACDAGKLHIG